MTLAACFKSAAAQGKVQKKTQQDRTVITPPSVSYLSYLPGFFSGVGRERTAITPQSVSYLSLPSRTSAERETCRRHIATIVASAFFAFFCGRDGRVVTFMIMVIGFLGPR